MPWFYSEGTTLAEMHRIAYEKSLSSNHAVRVYSGKYYYRGYEVDYSVERGSGYRWAYRAVKDRMGSMEFATTKKECLLCIDNEIKDKGD